MAEALPAAWLWPLARAKAAVWTQENMYGLKPAAVSLRCRLESVFLSLCPSEVLALLRRTLAKSLS